MKAFWWFKENSIAGMARPGFNATPWFELPFDEALLVGWIGQHPSGNTSREDFLRHAQEYGPKILKFYKVGTEAASRAMASLESAEQLASALERVAHRAGILDSYQVTDERISFRFSEARLREELGFLREQGIGTVVTLTERHNNREELSQHFSTAHISINDLDAPRTEQVEQLAEILRNAGERGEKVAVHCLAGIGRTSTMLLSAHMLLGEPLAELKARIAQQNPFFVLTGRQAEFIEGLEKRLGRPPAGTP